MFRLFEMRKELLPDFGTSVMSRNWRGGTDSPVLTIWFCVCEHLWQMGVPTSGRMSARKTESSFRSWECRKALNAATWVESAKHCRPWQISNTQCGRMEIELLGLLFEERRPWEFKVQSSPFEIHLCCQLTLHKGVLYTLLIWPDGVFLDLGFFCGIWSAILVDDSCISLGRQKKGEAASRHSPQFSQVGAIVLSL